MMIHTDTIRKPARKVVKIAFDNECDEQLIAFAMLVTGESRSSLFGREVSNIVSNHDHLLATVTLWTD